MDEFARWKAEQAAAWLEHVRGLAHDIARLKDKVDILESLALPGGIDYSRPVVSASPSPDAIPNAVIRLHESIDDYCATLTLYVAEEADANARLCMIGDWRFRDVLIRYYVDGMSWREVGDAMGYAPDYCRELRSAALQEVFDVMPVEWRASMPSAV